VPKVFEHCTAVQLRSSRRSIKGCTLRQQQTTLYHRLAYHQENQGCTNSIPTNKHQEGTHLRPIYYGKLTKYSPQSVAYRLHFSSNALRQQLSNIKKTQSVTTSSAQIDSALAPDLEINSVFSASASRRNRPRLSQYHRSSTIDPPLACRVATSSSEHAQPVLRP
jgi:hypothetical protein